MSTQKNLSNRQILETRYKNSRSNLLLVIAFSVINLILLITQSNTYFLFSAYIPYALVNLGMILCGMYPAEYYGEDVIGFLDSSVFAVCLAIAAIIITLYVISWIFSKNNKSGWLIFALVFFAIDTVGMFAFVGFQFDSIIDIAFHVWVIVSLAMGINASSKLKKLTEEEVTVPEAEQTEKIVENDQNSEMIRMAESNVKSRILLEADVLGHTVTYRRVKRVNELVIDGKVYDEMEALFEFRHSLNAQIDGHTIEVGFDGKAYSYIEVDGEIVAKKMRLI